MNTAVRLTLTCVVLAVAAFAFACESGGGSSTPATSPDTPRFVTPNLPSNGAAPSDQGAAVRAASSAVAPEMPLYQVYVVQIGDTIANISARFGIDAEYIIANNSDLGAAPLFVLGQSIIIPVGNGILHEVRFGETLSDIAARYDVSPNDIIAFAANHLTAVTDIAERQLIFVPNGRPPSAAVPPAAETSMP